MNEQLLNRLFPQRTFPMVGEAENSQEQSSCPKKIFFFNLGSIPHLELPEESPLN